jgi:glycosyltransferase involved in cell wall biosynthesis
VSLSTVTPLDEVRSATWEAASCRSAVVVSTHQRSALLPGLLAGLDAQIGGAFEVVVVDNGSTDATWQLLQEWAGQTALPARVLRVPFCDGPGVPRNTAVARVRADLVVFTDDDCLPAPDWVERLCGALLPGVAVVQGRTVPEADGWAGPWSRSLTVEGPTGLFETANLACRREDILAVGGFGGTRVLTGRAFGEDVLLGQALAARGEAVFCPAALVEHRVLPGSYRDFLSERWRRRGFPLLVARAPGIRSSLVGGVFLSRRTMVADLGLLACASAVVRRRPWPMLLAAPWFAACWRDAAHRDGRPRPVRAAQVGVGDAVGVAGLVTGSTQARRMVL